MNYAHSSLTNRNNFITLRYRWRNKSALFTKNNGQNRQWTGRNKSE